MIFSNILKINSTNNFIKVTRQIEINIKIIFQINLLIFINQKQRQYQFYFRLVNRCKSQTKTR